MLIRRILVPVDFSARSRPALQYALALAQMANAAVDVLHVVSGPSQLRIATEVWRGREAPRPSEYELGDARAQLRGLVDGCERHGIVPMLHVAAGDAAATIVRLAAELPADLVVMATRSRHGIEELALGSVAQRVIACASCPVVALGRDLTRHTGV
jgi:nucleotide-binding universal stress UspA family protein